MFEPNAYDSESNSLEPPTVIDDSFDEHDTISLAAAVAMITKIFFILL